MRQPSLICLILTLEFSISVSQAIGSMETQYAAVPGLGDTEEVVTLAYQAVLRAEQAGANVSELLDRLNEATSLLAQAQVAYRIGHFEEATSLASLSRNIGVGVRNDALTLRRSASSESYQSELFTVIASVGGVVLVIVGTIGAWKLLKKRYGHGVAGAQQSR